MRDKTDKNAGEKIFYIGILLVLLPGVVIFAMGYFRTEGYEGISMSVLLLLAGVIIFSLLMAVSFAAWVYEDCLKRGEDGVLWVILIFITGTFLGVLLYLLRRSEVKRDCPACGQRISLQAKYCEACGNLIESESREEISGMVKRTHHLKYIVCAAVCAVLMLASLIGFTVSMVSGGSVNSAVISDKNIWNSGIITMNVETKLGNTWKVKFNSASDGFLKEAKMKIRDASEEKLYADITCGKVPEGASLMLWIVQGDKAESIDVTNLSEPLEYALKGFENGKVRIRLQINGVKDVKAEIHVE